MHSFRSARIIAILIFMQILANGGCYSRNYQTNSFKVEDFSLQDQTKKNRFESSQHISQDIHQKSSLPLRIDIKGSSEIFNSIPEQAKPTVSALLAVNVPGCSFSIKSGPIVIDQFIYAGGWIKYKMALVANQAVWLEKNQQGSFRASMSLIPEFKGTKLSECRKFFEGRRLPIGWIHGNTTKIKLLACCESPIIDFKYRSADTLPVYVYLNWPKGDQNPQLLDSFDVPASVETPIYRAEFKNHGAYYLAVEPTLIYLKVEALKITNTEAILSKTNKNSQKLGASRNNKNQQAPKNKIIYKNPNQIQNKNSQKPTKPGPTKPALVKSNKANK